MYQYGVAVVIPTLPERAAFLANAIQSVNAQTYSPIEVIVEEVQEGDDAGVTRNRALNRVSAPWVAFLDDDDELEPEHLEKLINGAKASKADVVYSWFKILRQDGQLAIVDDSLWLIDQHGQRRSGFGLPWSDHLRVSLNHNCFIHLCCLIRTDVAKRAKFPQTNTPEWPEPHSEDWGFWKRVLRLDPKVQFHHVPERTWHWRLWDGRTNGQPERRQRNLQMR